MERMRIYICRTTNQPVIGNVILIFHSFFYKIKLKKRVENDV